MKNLAIIFSIILTLPFILGVQLKSNQVKGVITSDCPELSKPRDGYNQDKTEIMHSNDPMATANRNIIVSLHPKSFKSQLNPTKDAFITQTEQTFVPHILPVTVGSKVHFLNEDEFFHNVQSQTKGSKFSIGRRAPGISYSVKIKKVGEISLMCNIHSHMNARILSFDTPYFTRVTADGSYSFKDIPDGDYQLQVFHPTCENITKLITLKDGNIVEHNFKLTNRP